MIEQLISFKNSKLLKEIGFATDSYTEFVFDKDGNELNLAFYDMSDKYARPSQTIVQKLLRDDYGFIIHVFACGSFMDKTTTPFSKFKPILKGMNKYNYSVNADIGQPASKEKGYKTFEEATEVALQSVLSYLKWKQDFEKLQNKN